MNNLLVKAWKLKKERLDPGNHTNERFWLRKWFEDALCDLKKLTINQKQFI